MNLCISLVFYIVQCPTLATPTNGGRLCLLMSGIIPSYEDTCTFSCDIGYELTGNDTRTCQSDGSWSGSDVMCRRGRYREKLCNF